MFTPEQKGLLFNGSIMLALTAGALTSHLYHPGHAEVNAVSTSNQLPVSNLISNCVVRSVTSLDAPTAEKIANGNFSNWNSLNDLIPHGDDLYTGVTTVYTDPTISDENRTRHETDDVVRELEEHTDFKPNPMPTVVQGLGSYAANSVILTNFFCES